MRGIAEWDIAIRISRIRISMWLTPRKDSCESMSPSLILLLLFVPNTPGSLKTSTQGETVPQPSLPVRLVRASVPSPQIVDALENQKPTGTVTVKASVSETGVIAEAKVTHRDGHVYLTSSYFEQLVGTWRFAADERVGAHVVVIEFVFVPLGDSATTSERSAAIELSENRVDVGIEF